MILINFIANISSTGKRFDETEWSQEVEEEASLIQPSGIYWDYIMSQGSQPVMNDGGGEKEDDSSGGETTSAGKEDGTTDGGGGNRTTDVEGGNVTTDGGGGNRTTDVEGGNVTTDGGGDKIKKKMRHPNKLRTGRVSVLTIDEAKF